MGKSIGELVLLARQDDQNAINELYNQTFKKAYFVARTAIKSSDGDYSSQIEDILQDAYVKAFSSLDKLEDPEKFQGWLDTIVINRCKDFLKKKKPTLFSDMVSENSDDGSVLEFEDSRENDRMEFKPEETVDYGETKRLIAEMLDRMPEDQKMCLLMYYYEEMSVRQIAEAMDCSEGTIKSRLNYARKNLKGQVLELEKKGTKLYCMPLLPFLYWFFREQAAEFIGGTAGTVAAGAAASTAAAGAGQSVSTESASSVAGQTAAIGQAASAGAAGTAQERWRNIFFSSPVPPLKLEIGEARNVLGCQQRNPAQGNHQHQIHRADPSCHAGGGGFGRAQIVISPGENFYHGRQGKCQLHQSRTAQSQGR